MKWYESLSQVGHWWVGKHGGEGIGWVTEGFLEKVTFEKSE